MITKERHTSFDKQPLFPTLLDYEGHKGDWVWVINTYLLTKKGAQRGLQTHRTQNHGGLQSKYVVQWVIEYIQILALQQIT